MSNPISLPPAKVPDRPLSFTHQHKKALIDLGRDAESITIFDARPFLAQSSQGFQM
jgi:hypothetical protein